MIARIIKRLLHRLIRGLFTHPIRAVILLGVLLAATGVLFFRAGLQGPSMSLPGIGGLARIGGDAPQATENFMRGMASYDANLAWGSLSDEARARMESRGGGIDAMRADLERSRQFGARYEQINYVGGQSFPDGTSFHFYTVAMLGPPFGGNEPRYVWYVFTVDSAGKISSFQ
jgi:hypothetical protein